MIRPPGDHVAASRAGRPMAPAGAWRGSGLMAAQGRVDGQGRRVPEMAPAHLDHGRENGDSDPASGGAYLKQARLWKSPAARGWRGRAVAEGEDNPNLRLPREIRADPTAVKEGRSDGNRRLTQMARPLAEMRETLDRAAGMAVHAGVAGEKAGEYPDEIRDRIGASRRRVAELEMHK